MKVLIVDDDFVDRESIKRSLKKEYRTCEVVEVETVDESLKLIKQDSFDIVLVDYNLPQRSGIELLLELKGDDAIKNTAFIMISTDEEERLSRECKQAGAHDYLAKTEITSQILKQAITQARASFLIKQPIKAE
ncbi:hypothetical protein A9Q79_01625 [Methylophaga sp. 42_25_T18]|nr:hypothetical protein A9Q79_01625 [Methylophaga sp. 42_25_T18]